MVMGILMIVEYAIVIPATTANVIILTIAVSVMAIIQIAGLLILQLV